MSQQSASSARIEAYIAREAPVAAVLRRGPSKQVLLSKWDLTTDAFEDGQWFKGRIYEGRCDLSPDGEFFIYFAGNHKPPYFTWTAISTLPWLTAHALWAEGDTWGGGGLFALSKCIALSNFKPGDKPTKGSVPVSWSKIIPIGEYGKFKGSYSLEALRMMRDGWVCEQTDKWARTNRAGTVLRLHLSAEGNQDGRWRDCHGQLGFGDGNQFDLREIDWADFDHNGDVLYAFDGALYRRGNNGLDEPRLIRDLNDLKFCERQAPYHDRSKGPDTNSPTWHPLDN